MRIADVIGLPSEERSALFYGLLLKDLACSSNAARFAALFAADDHTVKANLKTINWSRVHESLGFVLRNVAPGQFWMRRVWQTLALLSRGPEGSRDVVRTRCERGADIARLLGFTIDTPGPMVCRRPCRSVSRPGTTMSCGCFRRTERHDRVLVYGAVINVPLSERFTVFGASNLMTPAATGTVDAFLGVSWSPGGGARRAPTYQYTPVLPVANNPDFAVNLTR